MHFVGHDIDVWNSIPKAHKWALDKLMLADRLGYVCGPSGISVPKRDTYIIRPCVNLHGMGKGAFKAEIGKTTDLIVPPGYFWSEVFEGDHYSVDYYGGQQVLCVLGEKGLEDFTQFSKWCKIKKDIPFPKELSDLGIGEGWINVEFIGDKIVEIHFRNNPDFCGHGSDYIIPVWQGQSVKIGKNQKYVEAKDGKRLGYVVENESR